MLHFKVAALLDTITVLMQTIDFKIVTQRFLKSHFEAQWVTSDSLHLGSACLLQGCPMDV